ncbi:ABC transporter ATP-binding protein [Microbispora sp. NEAU-D428]|uniref:ATP-binding cassette domain-containing protein n=1 Tax=Microbispora sitophila TaxID=2771537 RepID=UPI001866AC11|nr:ABC transporter ATP-binding protein [Microbispora sitophila]MBE3015286.1 ABC transporter ATP-binding protein [Microbispora sitophila]
MRLRNVSYRYRRKGPWVLRGVDVEVAPGRITEVTGANGAGKSTLLRLVAGLARPSAGHIEHRPRIVGYAPERFPAALPFTVQEYLEHVCRIRGVRVAGRQAVIGHWTERLRCRHLAATRIRDLSKGSAQKVGLIQAFLAKPELLVLDEPFAGLDVAAMNAVSAAVGEVAAQGGSVVVSDHQNYLGDIDLRQRWEVGGGTVSVLPGSPKPREEKQTVVLRVRVEARSAGVAVEHLRELGYDVEIGGPAEVRK